MNVQQNQTARPAGTRVRLLVTPEQANAWLKNNTCNRPIREQHWRALARDIKEGRWKYNGESIKFAVDGTLLDGQHRLLACVDAGVACETDVIFGLDPNVMDTIDIGRARTAADVVSMKGVENASNACAAAALLLIHEKHGLGSFGGNRAPTKTEVVAFVEANPRLSKVAGCSALRLSQLVQPRIALACYYLFSAQDQVLADRFFDAMHTGVGLRRNDPVYLLRERMVKNRASKAKLGLVETTALFFKAWVAYRDGASIGCLRWSPSNGEGFPDISYTQPNPQRTRQKEGGRP